MLFVVFLLLVMTSTAAHDIPAFSWNNRPQLVTFTFEGPLNTTDSSIAVLLGSSNGRLACSRSIPATWFATDCTPDLQALQTSHIEIAAFSTANDDNQSTASCLRASTTVNGLRTADGSNASSSFKYSLIESPSFLWPFVEGDLIRVPFVTSDAIAVMTALANNYDGMRAPAVISLTSLIQSIGRDATKTIVQKIMSLDEVVAVSADQLSSLAKVTSAAEAESIVNLCRPIDQISSSNATTPSPIATTPSPIATTTSPVLTTAPALETATPVSAAPNTTTTSAPLIPQGNSTAAAANSSSAPIGTDAPTVPMPNTSTSTNVSAAPTRTAPLAGSSSTIIPTPASSSMPNSTSTLIAKPNSTSTASPTGKMTSTPITLGPSSKPIQTTTAPNLIGNVPANGNGPTDSSKDSSSSSSSSSKTTGYVPYVIGIGGGLCAMAVAIVYKVFKREDRFPPVITNGYVFESEDRGIYDLEAYNSSVRVAPESHEGSSSYVHSELESASTMS